MSFLNQLFEKADVKQMSQGMDVQSIRASTQRIIEASGAMKRVPEQDVQRLLAEVDTVIQKSCTEYAATVPLFRKVLNDKEDRVTWAVRICKLTNVIMPLKVIHGSISHSVPDGAQLPSGVDETIDWYSLIIKEYKFVSKLNGRSRVDLVDTLGELWVAGWSRTKRLVTEFEHYFSQGIHSIDRMVFHNQSLYTIIQELDTLEKEYRDRFSRYIEHDEDDTEVIAWYDKKTKAWVRLDRASCSDEADAMGHCGNSPRSHTDDNILSFRTLHVAGGQKYWEPHLTFILKSDGYITEMKGRGNEKPAERYHPYIIDLLKKDIIHGIQGGGYMPENNFSLNDLDYNDKKKLLDAKPTLMSPLEAWMENVPGSPQALLNHIHSMGIYNVHEINEHFMLIDTGNTVRDIQYLMTDMDNFVKNGINKGFKKPHLEWLYEFIKRIFNENYDIDEVIEELEEIQLFSKKEYLTTVLSEIFKSNDVRIKKAIFDKIRTSDINPDQMEFDFINKSKTFLNNIATIADILVVEGFDLSKDSFDKFTVNMLEEVINSILYNYYYGDSMPFVTLTRRTLPIGDELVLGENSGDSELPEEWSEDDWLRHALDSSLEHSGEAPNHFGVEDWPEADTHYLTAYTKYIFSGEFDLSKMGKDWLEHTIYDLHQTLEGKPHPKDKRDKK